ncbi:MAG: hypothetical protein HC853_01775 [Anaerolineae bacterium]|nr:hypothetical protein [Anaerolineae bacterium]
MLRQTLGSLLTNSKASSPTPNRPSPNRRWLFYGALAVVLLGVYGFGLGLGRFLLHANPQSAQSAHAASAWAEHLFALSGVLLAFHPTHGLLRRWFFGHVSTSLPSMDAHSHAALGYMTGLWVVIMRVVWLAVTAASCYVMAIAMPLLFAGLMQEQPAPTDPIALSISTAQVQALQALGLSPHLYGLLFVGNRLLIYALFMLIAIIIAWRRSNHWVAMLVSLFLISFATTGAVEQRFVTQSAPTAYWISEGIQTLANMLILVVLYLFPNGRFVPGWSRTLLVAWLAFHALCLFLPNMPFNFTFGDTWIRTFWASLVFSELWVATGLIAIVYRYRHTTLVLERLQIKWVMLTWLWAYVAGAVYICVPLLLSLNDIQFDGLPRTLYTLAREVLGGAGIALGAVAFGLAMLRHKLWDIERVVQRSVLWLVASVLVLSGYVLFTVIIVRLLRNVVWFNSTFILVVYTLLAALCFNPLRQRAQRAINRKFDRARVDLGVALATLARDLRDTRDVSHQLQVLLQHAVQQLQVAHGAVVLFDSSRSTLGTHSGLSLNASPVPTDEVSTVSHAHNLTPELCAHLLAEWPMHTWPAQQRTPDLSGPGPFHRLRQLGLREHGKSGVGAHVPPQRHFPAILPLTALYRGQIVQIGILALGPRLSEQAYTPKDFELLTGLVEQTRAAMSLFQLAFVEHELEQEVNAQRRSPQGEAHALMQRWLEQPDAALPDLHELAQQTQPQAQAILESLPQAAASADSPVLQALCRGYRFWQHASDNPEMLVVGLREIVVGLGLATGWPCAPESLHLFGFVCSGSPSITSLISRRCRLQNTPHRGTHLIPHHSTHLLPHLSPNTCTRWGKHCTALCRSFRLSPPASMPAPSRSNQLLKPS